MQVIRGTPERAGAGYHYPVITIGNFDGLHLGHRRIIESVVTGARRSGGTAAVMTFDPHPLRILAPEKAPSQLQTLEQKIRSLERLEVDLALIVPFTKELAACPAHEFAQMLGSKLGVKEVHVGENFSFGRGREGNVGLLREVGRQAGYKVEIVGPVKFRNTVVSSTRIRQLVRQGRVALAARLLGRCYSIVGSVVEGRRVGATIGFPTANIAPENEIIPCFGVYVTLVDINGRRYQSVTNIGLRPTFAGPGEQSTIETFVFDFNGPLYGAKVELEFCFRLRDERKFPSVEALVAQIRRDVARAALYFHRSGHRTHRGNVSLFSTPSAVKE